MKNAIVQKQQDAHLINIAGRQQMLTQRITQLCLRLLFYSTNKEPELSTKIIIQTQALKAASDTLMNAKSLSISTTKLQASKLDSLFKDIQPTENRLINLATEIANSTNHAHNNNIDSLLTEQKIFLPKMERIVSECEEISNYKLDRIYALNNWFVYVAIAVLLAEALLIFIPIIKKNDKFVSEIKKKSKLLSKQNEELKESEEKFRFIAENTSDGIMVFEIDRITFTSPSYDKILGLPHDKVISRTIDDIINAIHPEDRDRVVKLYEDYEKVRKESFIYEYKMMHPKGHYIWREDKTKLIYDEKGGVIKAVILAHDISKRKSFEAKRKEREQMLSSLFDATSDMIAVLDVVDIDKYTFAFFNKTYEVKTGVNVHEYKGKFLHEKIKGAELEALLKTYRQCILTKEPVRWLLIHDYPAGRLTCDATAIPIFDSTGKCTRIVFSAYDLTEKHAHLQTIEDHSKQLKDIAWIQSHIVRAPLAKILGIINLISSKSDNKDYQKALLPALKASAHELDEAIRDIVSKAIDTDNK